MMQDILHCPQHVLQVPYLFRTVMKPSQDKYQSLRHVMEDMIGTRPPLAYNLVLEEGAQIFLKCLISVWSQTPFDAYIMHGICCIYMKVFFTMHLPKPDIMWCRLRLASYFPWFTTLCLMPALRSAQNYRLQSDERTLFGAFRRCHWYIFSPGAEINLLLHIYQGHRH